MVVRNQVPVVPCVFTFREPTGIRKIFKRKKDVTLKILKPVYSDSDKYIRQQVHELKEKVAFEMKETLAKQEQLYKQYQTWKIKIL